MASLLFAEEQGSFLVGAAAALKSQTGTVGFIGGVETDLIKKFEAGFIAGAEAVNPDIEVLSQYITQPPDFAGSTTRPAARRSPRRCTATAPTSSTRPPAAPASVSSRPPARPASPARCGRSASTATSTTWSTPALQPYILTSMLKKVDVAVYETIEALTEGEFRGGAQTFDLSTGGVDYSTSGGFVDDIADQLDEFKQQIIDGEIEVPTAP